MKAFIYSVLGAIVSGIVLFVVQQYLTEKPIPTNYEIAYNIEDNAIDFKKEDIDQIAKSTEELFGRVTIGFITIKNSGNQPLVDQEVIVRVGRIGEADTSTTLGRGILKVGVLAYPAKDTESVSSQLKGDRLSLRYKVLNPGEFQRLWIAYNALGQMTVSARRPGLVLTEGIKEDARASDETSDPLLTFIGLGILGLFVFLSGMLACFAGIHNDLKARGYDLAEISKKPKIVEVTTDA